MTRASSSLRTQLIKFLRSIPPRDVEDNVQLFTTYIRSAMTSLAADIRTDGIEILSWLLETAGLDVVRCRDGWTKILRCFVAVLGWDKAATGNGGRLASTARLNATDKAKATARQLQVLGLMLRFGIGSAEPDSDEDEHITPPLWFTYQHLLPRQTNCFAHLDLFAQTEDEDELSCESRECRIKIFKQYQGILEGGLESCRRQGGEQGRVSAHVIQLIHDNAKNTM